MINIEAAKAALQEANGSLDEYYSTEFCRNFAPQLIAMVEELQNQVSQLQTAKRYEEQQTPQWRRDIR
jgi:hypothetical protein